MSLNTPSPNVCKLVFSLNNLFSLSAASIMHHNWHRPVSCFCSDSTSTVMISLPDVLLSSTKPPSTVVESTNNMQPSEITSEEELLLYHCKKMECDFNTFLCRSCHYSGNFATIITLNVLKSHSIFYSVLQYGIVHCNTTVGQHLILITSTMPLNTMTPNSPGNCD